MSNSPSDIILNGMLLTTIGEEGVAVSWRTLGSSFMISLALLAMAFTESIHNRSSSYTHTHTHTYTYKHMPYILTYIHTRAHSQEQIELDVSRKLLWNHMCMFDMVMLVLIYFLVGLVFQI